MRSITLVAISLFGLALTSANAQTTIPDRVDLRSFQSPLKNQGNRTSCITFSAVAALEAAYKRAGHGEVDLSEEFASYFAKMSWIHPVWPDMAPGGARGGPDFAETQLGITGGGNGSGFLEGLSRDFKVPVEATMPYQLREYNASDDPDISKPWNDVFWERQRNQSRLNLALLKPAALTADKYYSGTGFTKIQNPRDPELIARAIAAQREVVIDFDGSYKLRDLDGNRKKIWDPCTGNSCRQSGAHSMLIVGYDKTARDRKDWYFLVKNSWKHTSNTDEINWTTDQAGWTRISFDFAREAIYNASYITGVKHPTTWPALNVIGRWETNFDGHKGELDIYHVPGIMQVELDRDTYEARNGGKITDRRLGSYYDAQGKAYHVNGAVRGNTVEFYIDGENPKLRWDKFSGTRHQFTMLDGGASDVLAGWLRTKNGEFYGGYMSRAGLYPNGIETPNASGVNAYIGTKWQAEFNGISGIIQFDRSDDSVVPARLRDRHFGMTGRFIRDGGNGSTEGVVASVPREASNQISISIPSVLGDPTQSLENQGWIDARKMSWENGVVAGSGISTAANNFGFVMYSIE